MDTNASESDPDELMNRAAASIGVQFYFDDNDGTLRTGVMAELDRSDNHVKLYVSIDADSGFPCWVPVTAVKW